MHSLELANREAVMELAANKRFSLSLKQRYFAAWQEAARARGIDTGKVCCMKQFAMSTNTDCSYKQHKDSISSDFYLRECLVYVRYVGFVKFNSLTHLTM